MEVIFFFRSRQEGKEYIGPEWTKGGGGENRLAGILRSWGQIKANDVWWSIFNERYMNYPKFEMEWWTYRRTYHGMVGNGLMAKTLTEKYLSKEVRKMIGNVQDQAEI